MNCESWIGLAGCDVHLRTRRWSGLKRISRLVVSLRLAWRGKLVVPLSKSKRYWKTKVSTSIEYQYPRSSIEYPTIEYRSSILLVKYRCWAVSQWSSHQVSVGLQAVSFFCDDDAACVFVFVYVYDCDGDGVDVAVAVTFSWKMSWRWDGFKG